MPTLLDIPDLVMRRILKDADFKQIFRLRKVCSPLRTFLDLTLQPDIQLEWIQLSAITNGMSCYMGTNVDDYKNKKYDKQRTASFVLVDTDMKQWQDLAMILRYQKSSLKFLKLMCSLEENMDGYDKFLEFFMTILSTNETQLRVSNLKMHAMNQTQVLRVLPYLDPKDLVSISIENSMVFDTRGGDMEIDEIVQTEQYQKAKGLIMTLLEMPDVVMKRILNFSDIKTIFTLRRVCHGFREYIDSKKPDIALTSICFHVTSNGFSCEMGSNTFNHLKIRYMDSRLIYLGPPREPVENEYLLKSENPMELFLEDVGRILTHQKSSLSFLSITVQYMRYIPEYNQLLEFIKNILETRNTPLRAVSFRMSALEQDEVMQMLPLLDPSHISNIQIVETIINSYAFLTTSTCNQFDLHYKHFTDGHQFIQTLGEPILEEGSFVSKWYFGIPNSSDVILIAYTEPYRQIQFIRGEWIIPDDVVVVEGDRNENAELEQ
ncbi:hypothetical protein GCK72_019632 [Caenorhabditis remanei]|uniref:F-box domain-containing protein n=1 Tax=Caenorhabditis remanei TaxID=31234 RepID=A0A6A5GEE2_CAERE|nr:hypothetical protein GCK72_019632 [Caenorhabditis remanei]KAF1753076.1 hypothetical protein GCK72_019632 [Caenorhabditis remanei]